MPDLHLTIPGGMLWAVVIYLLVGAVAYLPLLAWMNKRVVSPPSPALSGARPLGFVVAAVAWPAYFWHVLTEPSRRRRSRERMAVAMERARAERPHG